MKLFHATPRNNTRSVLKNGIDNRRDVLATRPLRQFIDRNKPFTSTANTHDAIFLFSESELPVVMQKYPNFAIFEVDVTALDLFYLVAFNNYVSEVICDLRQDKHKITEAEQW